jgi:hypothetical protein
MQMRNLVCALYFDSHGQPWMASGQDGQFLKLDRNGRVLAAIGNGMGIGIGQFIEASYWVMDKQTTCTQAIRASAASPRWLRLDVRRDQRATALHYRP